MAKDIDDLTRMNAFDSGLISERIEELNEEIAALDYDILAANDEDIDGLKDDREPLMDELNKLTEFHEECGDGEYLIRWDYFRKYVTCELLPDTYPEVDKLPDFIKNNIDWDDVADDIQTDYNQADLDGVTFYWYAN